jgi:hypothetical protein
MTEENKNEAIKAPRSHVKTDETSSNSENKKKNITMIEVRGKRLLSPKGKCEKMYGMLSTICHTNTTPLRRH